MTRVLVTPVVSLPQSASWSQVIELLQPGFQVICAITVQGAAAKQVAKTVAQTIRSSQVTTAEELYTLLLECQSSARTSSTVCEVAAVRVEGSELICVCTRAVIHLKRGEKFGKLLNAEDSVQVRVGTHHPEDVLFLSTASSAVFMHEIEQKITQGYDVTTSITSIIPGVQSNELVATCAVACVTPGNQGVVLEQQQAATEAPTEDVAVRKKPNRQGARKLFALSNTTAKSILVLGKKVLQSVRTVYQHTPSVRSRLGGGVFLEGQQNKRIWFKLLGVLFLVGFLVTAWVLFARSQERARQEAAALVAPYVSQLTAAQTLVGEDPLTAREQVAQVVNSLEVLEETATNSAVQAEFIRQELDRAREIFTAISGREELSELPVFYDLRLIQSDFVATLAQGAGDKAVFVDQEKALAAVLTLESKQLLVLPLTGIGTVRSIVVDTDRLFILADGVYVLSLEPESTPQLIIPEGDSNRAGKFLGAYESFLYVLNPEKRNIYRYLEGEDGYSEPIGWLRSAVGTSLQDSVSLAIDGDLWLSTKTGTIKKYTSGSEADFTVAGLPDSFQSSVYLVTARDFSNLYALEPNSDRLVILDKNGTFLREIKHSSIGSATALVVSERLNKAFILSGSMVFEIGV